MSVLFRRSTPKGDNRQTPKEGRVSGAPWTSVTGLEREGGAVGEAALGRGVTRKIVVFSIGVPCELTFQRAIGLHAPRDPRSASCDAGSAAPVARPLAKEFAWSARGSLRRPCGAEFNARRGGSRVTASSTDCLEHAAGFHPLWAPVGACGPPRMPRNITKQGSFRN